MIPPPDTAAPVPSGDILVVLRTGATETLPLDQGSEWCWGYLDALSNHNLICTQAFRHASTALERLTGPEGRPRTEERH